MKVRQCLQLELAGGDLLILTDHWFGPDRYMVLEGVAKSRNLKSKRSLTLDQICEEFDIYPEAKEAIENLKE
jgi:hypothetical protein